MVALNKIYTIILQFSVVVLTLLFAWFTFVYYPKIVNEYKAGNFPIKQSIALPAGNNNRFPIETSAYRVDFEIASNTHYVFVRGNDLETYLTNRDGAKLALKSTLSLQSLCGLNLIYVSAQNLKIPQKYQSNTDCR